MSGAVAVRPSVRGTVRRRVSVAALAGLVVALLVPMAPAEAAAPTITISRGSVVGGESITVSGSTRVRKARPVVLQRQSGRTWVNVIRSRTTVAGSYKFLWKPPTRAGSRTVVRVVAPKVKIKRKTYKQVTTGGRTVLTVGQTASMTLPGLVSQGTPFSVTGKFTPARPGRKVALQKPSGSSWVSVGSGGVESSSGTVSIPVTLQVQGTFTFRLVALGANGAPAIATASDSVDVSLPVPTGVQAELAGNTSVTVTWNPVNVAGVAYRVYRRIDPNNDAAGWGQPVAVTSGSQFTVGNLSSSTTHYFTVTSFVGDQESAFATKASATTPAPPTDSTPPPVPVDVQATSGADATSQVTWSSGGAAQDLSGYRVYRKTATTDWVVAGTTGANVTTFAANGLTNNVEYTFAVTSFDDAPVSNESAKSATATATPQGPADVTPPPVPTGVGATGGSGSALVGWTGVTAEDLAGYRVYVGTSSSGPWTEETTTVLAPGTSTFNVSGLTNGTTYWFTVTSVDLVGNQSAKAPAASATPSAAAKTWSQVSGGGQHTCAVRSDGTLWCWGRNGEGQLGSPANIAQTSPAQVGTGSAWSQVSAGGAFTCAVQTDGTLWCWGQNNYGQVGNGSTDGFDVTVPTKVGTDTSWSSVSAGEFSVCALRTTGTLWCWGLNSDGQLGKASTGLNPNPTPSQVGALATWASVSAGTDHTCATKTDHTVWCFGSNLKGQLAVAVSTTDTPTPQQVAGITSDQVSAGEYHSCAVTTGGAISCWGSNEFGELGKAATGDAANPTPNTVSGTDYVQVSAGGDQTCAVRTTGLAFCWGRNQYAQVGKSASTAAYASPQQVTGTGWLSIDAGRAHVIGRKAAGPAFTWGWNSFGQLGTADNVETETPNPGPVSVSVPS